MKVSMALMPVRKGWRMRWRFERMRRLQIQD